MPITLNVGLSRKVSKDYNSNGYSINLNVELPADAVSDPSTIANSAENLFQLCDQLLEQQITGQGSPSTSGNGNGSTRRNGNGRDGSYQRSGNGHSGGRRTLTNAQEKAIHNMTRRLDENADDWAYNEFGADGIKNLSVKQASDFIDILKQEFADRESGVRQ